jgi:serine/threonine-protein phosphatase PGAM5
VRPDVAAQPGTRPRRSDAGTRGAGGWRGRGLGAVNAVRAGARGGMLALALALVGGRAGVVTAAPAGSGSPSPAQRGPAAGAPGKGTHFVLLVRHAHHHRDDTVSEVTANPLDSLGRVQARLVAARLAGLHVRFDRFVTSDFLRARETADSIGAAIGRTPQVDTLIHECTPTPEHPEYTTYHSPEDIAACVEQLGAAWSRYMAPTPQADTWDLLVCHGNVIRWLTLRAIGADTTRWYDPDIANASITVIEIRADGTRRVASFNDVGHLPPAAQTWSGRGWGTRGR